MGGLDVILHYVIMLIVEGQINGYKIDFEFAFVVDLKEL